MYEIKQGQPYTCTADALRAPYVLAYVVSFVLLEPYYITNAVVSNRLILCRLNVGQKLLSPCPVEASYKVC